MHKKLIRVLIALLVILLAGSIILPQAFAQEETPTPSAKSEATAQPDPEATPNSEATPAVTIDIGENLADAAASFDLSSLEPIDLLRLIVAIAIIAVFLLFGRRIVSNLLHRVAKRTATTFDDELIERTQGQIRWLVIIVGIDIGTFILFFDNEAIKDVFANIIFWFYYGILFSAAYTTLHFFFEWYEKQLEGDENRIAVFLPILRRFSMVLLIIFAAVILLDHLGINVTGLAAAAALIGLAIALAAQDIIGDLISGYVILMDRPFSVGDRIEIPDQDAWGDVVEIGTRTTRIRTRDNNLVIIPNSSIADGQVTNYTYPDPNYRLQSDIDIEYGENLEHVRKVLGDAVRSVDEVLKDQPVQVLFIEFGNSAMTIRVRWWIDTYSDKRMMQDKVNTALQEAIEKSGIISPNPAVDVNVKMKDGSQEGA
ncbi:MAG: mechanosensitive ion channel domain-containing protein [Anaerolineales bacterium]